MRWEVFSMCAHKAAERRSDLSPASLLTWLGGGQWRELDERHERSTHAVSGAVVLFGAVLAWLVATLAVSESTRWSLLSILPVTLVLGLLVGAVTRATAAGSPGGRAGVAARAAVAAALGAVVGELAAIVLLSGSIDHRLDERALRDAGSTPAVAQASASLQQTRDTRAALDGAVDRAHQQQDQALVIARCEYHPTPACPQTRITGVPGAGPETRTANEVLADAQRELDSALAARDRQAPALDAAISREQHALDEARRGVVADADRGLGARWVAMNDLTSADFGALTLRLMAIAFCVLVYLLPLILGRWRGETTQDRHASARAERERAELEADTAIAIKRAEVRREAEIMWAEHQLTQARMAIEAQTEIDREQQRRRIEAAFEPPARAPSQRTLEPADEDIYLPIAAEAEAASRALVGLPAPAQTTGVENLPAPAGREVAPREDRGASLIPSIPDATKAAARWVRPLVPPFVARVLDTTTAPLRTARQVFEEVEEITFALRRTHRVTMDSESSDAGERPTPSATTDEQPSPTTGFIDSSRVDRTAVTARRPGGQDPSAASLGASERGSAPELTQRDGPAELDPPADPRQLPPA
ncbi:putative integral membrane protein [Mycobacterium europaeum]|uniref:Putative integral membrane protein n=2 Tax=Mycobacterium europaeum TaxID=761804 RepID=A0A0U1DG86_9MYCO|nr:putative integral membrane protein [Mycobacterium europaeum]